MRLSAVRWVATIATALIFAGCGSDTVVLSPPPSIAGPVTTVPKASTLIQLPQLAPGTSFAYDISAVDPSLHRLYLADRTNKSLDIVNTTDNSLTSVGGFTGQIGTNNTISGPDGVVVIPGSSVVAVGDVNVVKFVDTTARTVVATTTTGTAGNRTDEGCYDKDDGLLMMANPGDATPYVTFISATSHNVVSTFAFAASQGLEACVYDPGTKNFLINNDGNNTNLLGEIDVISAASAVAGKPVISAVYPLPNCSPTGMILAPGEKLLVSCDPPNGLPLTSLVFNAATGKQLATIPLGGADQIDYDPFTNRFYEAARHNTASGIAGAPYTPVLGTIDANTFAVVGTTPTGNNAHSVAVDPSTGLIYVPLSPTATAPGGIQIFNP
ncbi:MAG: hypothetical protein NVS3B17_10390 [Vulcanimicrobiaceae bacterium]